MIGRRGFITGLVAVVAAPAIVRAGSLMPVKVMIEPYGVGPAIHALRLLHAERLVNPPYMDLFDFDAVARDMMKIMAVPSRWIQPR